MVSRIAKVIAITPYRFDGDYIDDWKENLADLVDDYLIEHDESGALMRDEGAFRESMIRRAESMGADWVIVMDPDERLEIGAARKLRRLIDRYSGKRVLFRFKFREMYTPTSYRVDGVWGKKERMFMFPIYEENVYSDSKLHAQKHPVNDYRVINTGLNVYHLKHINPRLIQHRAALYNKLDSESKWQSMGYDYLSDVSGMKLKKIPRKRMYTPAYRDYVIDEDMFNLDKY